jgi:hypothetical protein
MKARTTKELTELLEALERFVSDFQDKASAQVLAEYETDIKAVVAELSSRGVGLV